MHASFWLEAQVEHSLECTGYIHYSGIAIFNGERPTFSPSFQITMPDLS